MVWDPCEWCFSCGDILTPPVSASCSRQLISRKSCFCAEAIWIGTHLRARALNICYFDHGRIHTSVKYLGASYKIEALFMILTVTTFKPILTASYLRSSMLIGISLISIERCIRYRIDPSLIFYPKWMTKLIAILLGLFCI